jgi:HlyD family secretion protein
MKIIRTLYRARFVAAILLGIAMTACGGESAGEVATANLSTSVSESQPDAVRATGVVVPAQEAVLSFTTSGAVADLPVELGDIVRAGDLLARLDTSLLDADIAKAEAALAVAEANLAAARAGAEPEQIAEIEGAADTASAAVSLADAQRGALTAPPTAAQIASAQIEIQQAYVDMLDARTTYEWVRGVETHPEDYTSYQRANLPYQIDEYERAYNSSVLAYQSAQGRLADLLDGANPDQVSAASAAVWAASADTRSIESQLDLLLSLPRSTDLAVAEATVMLAQASVQAAQAARASAELLAPFDGVVSALYIQESQYVTTAMPVMVIGNLAHLQVDTTDLSERDVARIA